MHFDWNAFGRTAVTNVTVDGVWETTDGQTTKPYILFPGMLHSAEKLMFHSVRRAFSYSRFTICVIIML